MDTVIHSLQKYSTIRSVQSVLQFPKRMSSFGLLTIVAAFLALSTSMYSMVPSVEGRELQKRSFSQLGCLGIYDKAKFARLDRVCEECYQLYREPELQGLCRVDCFRNDIFPRCVDALLLGHEQSKLNEMVSDLYGKK